MKRLLPVLLLLVLPAAAYAQPVGDVSGFYLNGHLSGASIDFKDFDEVDREGGGGVGLTLGYGVNQRVVVYATLDGATIEADEADEFGLAHFDLGAKFHLGNSDKALRPYLDLALSGRGIQFDLGPQAVEMSGGGLTLGGGLKYFFKPSLALDTVLKLTFGEFNEVKFGGRTEDVNLDANTSRLHLGLSWYVNR